MPEKDKENKGFKPWIAIIIILALGLGVTGYLYFDLRSKSNEQIKDLNSRLLDKTTGLEEEIARNNRLESELRAEQARIQALVDEIGNISSTVGVLDKLSKTDPELLQKYSKVYFLNEHYVPPRLREIDKNYLLRPEDPEQIHGDVWPFLDNMLEDAEDDDIDLLVVSAFRSFGEQSSLKASYRVTYGSGANAFSADQGYSEHQLGTAVDFTTQPIGGTFTGFENTGVYSWLQENAHKYGFTLSYPPNNQFYIFEPWHWRYVGVDLATRLHNNGQYFYDLDQRVIDQYLVDIFD